MAKEELTPGSLRPTSFARDLGFALEKIRELLVLIDVGKDACLLFRG